LDTCIHGNVYMHTRSRQYSKSLLCDEMYTSSCHVNKLSQYPCLSSLVISDTIEEER
ncbi:hypothetical protein BgiBS90_005745, partial [Biomphalaria glabrata]